MIMTHWSLRPEQSRSAALAILVVGVLVVVGIVITPTYLLHRRYDRVLVDFKERLSQYQKLAAQHPEYARALEALKTKNGRRFYLKATAVNLAGAEVQELVRTTVEGHGGRLGSIQIGQPRESGGHRVIPVSVQLTANTPSLQRILYAIETQSPYLFVDNVALRATVFRGFRPNPGVEPEINIQLDVSGVMAGGEKG